MESILNITLILISATDIRFRIIPKRITFLSYLLLYSLNILNLFIGLMVYLIYVLMAKIFHILTSKVGIGYGDIRAAGLVIGFDQSLESGLKIHLLAWLIAGTFWILMNAIRGRWKSLPFAPFLTLAVYLS